MTSNDTSDLPYMDVRHDRAFVGFLAEAAMSGSPRLLHGELKYDEIMPLVQQYQERIKTQMDGVECDEVSVEEHAYHWVLYATSGGETSELALGMMPEDQIRIESLQKFFRTIICAAQKETDTSFPLVSMKGYCALTDRIEDILQSCLHCRSRVTLVDVTIKPKGLTSFFFGVRFAAETFHVINVEVPWDGK